MAEPAAPSMGRWRVIARGAWNHLRALFVLFHLLAVSLLAFPAPVGGINKRTFEDPQIQEAFSAWRGVLDRVGWHLSPAEFEDLAWDLGRRSLQARSRALAPFQPYARLMGTGQGWRMFGYNNRDPARMRLEVQEGGSWRVLWEARSAEATWNRRVFDEEHFRGVMNNYSWLRDRKSYDHFCRWLAVRVHQELPAASAIRVTMLERHSPEPDRLWTEGFPPDRERWQVELELGEAG